ncbi:MAG TPA: hypothetical protein VJS63_16570 [Bradyrhizobium sp.]|nr:hypothetical protein [Bradyrhizobium sp.]
MRVSKSERGKIIKPLLRTLKIIASAAAVASTLGSAPLTNPRAGLAKRLENLAF